MNCIDVDIYPQMLNRYPSLYESDRENKIEETMRFAACLQSKRVK